MVTLGMLWLPILLSTVAAWVLNALFWTISPHHKADWQGLPDERGVLAALRAAGLRRGMYYFPVEKGGGADGGQGAETGPSGYLIVKAPGPAGMGAPMALSLLLNLAVSVLAAYVLTVGLEAGAAYMDVFRAVTTVVFLAYAASRFSEAIWFSYDWGSTWKSAVDAAIIALVTGGIFGWLWPQ